MLLTGNGVDLFYTTHGSGRPMLLMHGGLGPDHTYFRPWLDALSDRVELVYYDHRGGGRSGRLASFDGITHETLVDDADRLMRYLGHDRFVLLGHSYGGMLALEYALRHPDRLDGLILCCTAPAWDYADEIGRNAAARGTPDQLAALEELRHLPIGSDERFQQLWVDIQPLYFHQVDPQIIAEMDAAMRYSASAFELSEILLADFDLSGRIRELTVPTLILAGRDDWVTPPSQALRIQEAVSHADLVIFEASGHYPFVEESERFMQTVGDWIEHTRRRLHRDFA